MAAVGAKLVLETPISSGANGPGFNAKVNQTATFDIPVHHIAAPHRIATAWFNVVENFRQLELFQTIKVAPVVKDNGGNAIRLTFHPNEEPIHVGIQIFADGE
jgi:hypothetical protein